MTSSNDERPEFSSRSDNEFLDTHEVRVLAVLAEKEALTPDNYPLSLNALVNGCNQLTSRDPIMSLDENLVQDIVQRLVQKRLVSEVRQAGARVTKFEHRMRPQWSLEQDRLAVLAMLMLRGPQTAGEIRSRSGRLHEFASVAHVEECLQFLIDKFPPLVVRRARAPGAKEVRYAHLLCGGDMSDDASDVVAADSTRFESGADRVALLELEIERLRAQMESLEVQFADFKKQFE